MDSEVFYWKIKNRYRRSKTWIKQALIDHDGRKILQSNSKLANVHKGKRCFILGNGPSLNLYDLSCLKKEFVFSVNEFVRFDQIKDVRPDFYAIADSKFFELKPESEQDQIFRDKIENLNVINPNMIMFFPLSVRENIRFLKWQDNLEVRYFNSYTYFYKGYNDTIDLTRMIPSMQNVVQYCILIAIYMGFEEIYLLGTDQTNIFGNLKAFISNDISEYAFQMCDEERKWKHEQLVESSLVDTLRGYARIFEIFDELNSYCIRAGINLYNCAPETMITSIPKMNFLSLF